MTNYAGFQKTVNPTVNEASIGQMLSGRTFATQGGTGAVAGEQLIVGAGCFLDGDLAFADSAKTTTAKPLFGGIIAQNMGFTSWGWAETELGYSMVVPQAKEPLIIFAGEVAVLLATVDATGTVTGEAEAGQSVFINLTTGVLASSDEDTVTGYLKTQFVVNKVGLINYDNELSYPDDYSLCSVIA